MSYQLEPQQDGSIVIPSAILKMYDIAVGKSVHLDKLNDGLKLSNHTGTLKKIKDDFHKSGGMDALPSVDEFIAWRREEAILEQQKYDALAKKES